MHPRRYIAINTPNGRARIDALSVIAWYDTLDQPGHTTIVVSSLTLPIVAAESLDSFGARLATVLANHASFLPDNAPSRNVWADTAPAGPPRTAPPVGVKPASVREAERREVDYPAAPEPPAEPEEITHHNGSFATKVVIKPAPDA